jgi:predicted cupin superfamily sugar epimerase
MSREEELIAYFGMKPLPVEGTYFANTYTSEDKTPAGGPVGTAGVGLYRSHPRSASTFHALEFDEVWHFYEGDPIRLIELHPKGMVREIILGRDIEAGQLLQHTVYAGVIQAGELVEGGTWGLFACTMSPGFIGTCFRGVTKSELHRSYPQARIIIERLGVPDGEEAMLPEGYLS